MASSEFRRRNFEMFIRQMIPKELIPSSWKCDKPDLNSNLESLYAEERSKLAMFKSADKLIEEFQEYLSYPVGYLVIDPSASIEPDLRKKCIYTADIINVFQFLPNPPEGRLEGLTLKLARMILGACWDKIREDAIRHKMICPYSIADSMFTVPEHPASPENGNYRYVITSFEEHWMKKIGGMSKVISDWIKCYEEINPETNLTKELAVAAEYVGSAMQQIANYGTRECIHFPPLNKEKKPKAFIRVFPVGNEYYVIANEFIKYCESQKIKVEELKKQIIGKPELTTFPFKKVAPMLKKKQVVKMNQLRLLTFVQTQIPIDDGGYCIPAADALYELLMDMIAAKKVFHHINQSDWERIITFFESIELYFDANESVYFLDAQDIHVINTMWEYVYINHLESNNTSENKKKPECRPGHYFENVFKRLGLETRFENIADYAASLYSKLIASNADSAQFNMDLSLIRCQFNSFARKVPNILKFIHNQKSCDRLCIVDCVHCEMEKDEKNQGQGGVSKMKKK